MNEEKVKGQRSEVKGQEEPVTIGCPSMGLPRIPSGADGTEPEEGQRSKVKVEEGQRSKVKVEEGQRSKVKGQTEESNHHCLTSDLGPLTSTLTSDLGPLTLYRTDYEQIIADVFHKCNEAFIHAPQQRDARPGYFKVVVGDLADALASVVPCDNRGRGSLAASDKDGASADDATRTSRPHEKEVVYRTPQHIVDFIFETCNVPFADQADPAFLKKIAEKFHLSPNKSAADYWKVAEGVQLTRYKGTNVTRLIAVRKGKESNPDVIFEIFINATTKNATIKRDDTVLFTIGVDGLSARRVENVAISVLRSYLRENARAHRHGKERIHRRVAERLAARMNAEPTAEEIENA